MASTNQMFQLLCLYYVVGSLFITNYNENEVILNNSNNSRVDCPLIIASNIFTVRVSASGNQNFKIDRGCNAEPRLTVLTWAFHGQRKNLTLEGGFETRRSRLQLIALTLES